MTRCCSSSPRFCTRGSRVPDEHYTIPSVRRLVREGDDVTVVAFGQMVPKAAAAIDELAEEGISCDLIDPRHHITPG